MGVGCFFRVMRWVGGFWVWVVYGVLGALSQAAHDGRHGSCSGCVFGDRESLYSYSNLVSRSRRIGSNFYIAESLFHQNGLNVRLHVLVPGT